MKVWFDVSGLYNWEGNFTGIQRVVYNLGNELHIADPEAEFFIYRGGGFHRITFGDLESRIQERSRSLNRAFTATVPTRNWLNSRALMYHSIVALKRIIHGTKLDPPLRAVYSRLRSAYHGMKGQQVMVMPQTLFGSNDVVVVADGNWQFGGYIEAMSAAKKQAHFKFVHMVYDLVAVRNPALANPAADKVIGDYFKRVLIFSDLLLTISDSTTRDVEWFMNRLDIHGPLIRKVTLGDNVTSNVQRRYKKPDVKLPERFILAVSTIEVRKNYASLYYAYKLASQEKISLPHLVVVGRKGWMAEETYTLLTQDSEIKDKVTILTGVADPELEWLYQHCQFTVFPSFYEGWGLPVAESFARGKACISSNTSSMPEIGGDLARYVSPYNPKEIMENIEKLSADSQLRKRLESQIKARYVARGWNQTCEEFLNTLRLMYEPEE